MKFQPIYLASRSPRRQELLKAIGIKYTVLEVEVEENDHGIDNPSEYVLTVSLKKASAAAHKIKSGIVAAADTIVYLEGKIFTKPSSAQNAIEMLRTLSGKTHQVYTGFTLLKVPSMELLQHCEVTEVTFRLLNDDEIIEYVRTGAPMDKAGAYGIQNDLSAVFVDKIHGDFFNVVGLPLTRFYLALRQFQNA
ncbi:MAG: Maf family protein [Candidatus Kryptoniota bacterium]